MESYWDTKSPEEPSVEGTVDFLGKSYFFNVVPSVKALPEWLKSLGPRVSTTVDGVDNLEVFTVKKCIPFLDAMTTGYMVVAAQDIDVKTSDSVTTHPIEQLGGMPVSDEFEYVAYKWLNSFLIKTPEGYSCMFSHPANSPFLPFYTLSGVVDTDSFFQAVNFPFLLKKGASVIKAGTPIVQVMPFKREDWKSNHSTPSSEQFLSESNLVGRMYNDNRFDNSGKLVGGLYKRFYRVKKKYL
jgi:hypothetical protein